MIANWAMQKLHSLTCGDIGHAARIVPALDGVAVVRLMRACPERILGRAPLAGEFWALHQLHRLCRIDATYAQATGEGGPMHKRSPCTGVGETIATAIPTSRPLDKGVGVAIPIPCVAVWQEEWEAASYMPQHVWPLCALCLDRGEGARHTAPASLDRLCGDETWRPGPHEGRARVLHCVL